MPWVGPFHLFFSSVDISFFSLFLIWAGYYYSELNNDTSALRCFVSLNTKRDKSICMLKGDNNSSTSELQKKSSLYLDWLLANWRKLESIIAWLGWGDCAHSDICANICDLFCLMKLLMHFFFLSLFYTLEINEKFPRLFF